MDFLEEVTKLAEMLVKTCFLNWTGKWLAEELLF